MKIKNDIQLPGELDILCTTVRELVEENKFDECIVVISNAMLNHPHAPHPHNLLGIVLERMGDHATAMKHFRAAWALDPAYLPANHNLNTYGTFFSDGGCAFDESDVPPPAPSNIEIVYDDRGIGHAVSKTQIRYDERGIGHVTRR